jgi:hypothetical protein
MSDTEKRSDDERQEPITILIRVDSIDIPKKWRKVDQKKVDQIAASMKEEGQLEPIGVWMIPTLVPGGPQRYRLVYGKHRLGAARKNGDDLIEAKVGDWDYEDLEAITQAENLFRSELSKAEYMESLGIWVARYKAKHPESVEPPFERATLGRIRAAAAERGEDPGPAPAPAPAVVIAQITGMDERQARRHVKIAESLKPEELEVLKERKPNIDELKTFGQLSDSARPKALSLVASGMDVKTAVAAATAPTDAKIESVVQQDDPSVKPESEMTDEEWLEAYCGEFLGKLKFTMDFRRDANLWRATRQARAKFKADIKRDLKQSKAVQTGPFAGMIGRVVNVAHPNDWQVCGPCGGSGQAGATSKCPTCNGHGYKVKTLG